VKARWARQQAAWKSSGNEMAPYAFALAGGDWERGAMEFWANAVLPCARCHKVNGGGGEAGPDLTLIGKQKSPEYLLESILKPNLHIAEGFDVVALTLKDGSSETGSIESENDTQVVLKRADGSKATISKAQIQQRVTAPSSMPEIYGQVMTRQQLRDVVTFLQGLQVADTGMNQDGVPRAMQKTVTEGKTGGHP
jgi:putative heme-binding domain-containing protein